jgi:hypothetical protein
VADAQRLAARLGDRADVWLPPTGPLTRDLRHRLPQGLDVYGGAVRLWRPDPAMPDPDPRHHPR